jgi:hypothetical protein
MSLSLSRPRKKNFRRNKVCNTRTYTIQKTDQWWGGSQIFYRLDDNSTCGVLHNQWCDLSLAICFVGVRTSPRESHLKSKHQVSFASRNWHRSTFLPRNNITFRITNKEKRRNHMSFRAQRTSMNSIVCSEIYPSSNNFSVSLLNNRQFKVPISTGLR